MFIPFHSSFNSTKVRVLGKEGMIVGRGERDLGDSKMVVDIHHSRWHEFTDRAVPSLSAVSGSNNRNQCSYSDKWALTGVGGAIRLVSGTGGTTRIAVRKQVPSTVPAKRANRIQFRDNAIQKKKLILLGPLPRRIRQKSEFLE